MTFPNRGGEIVTYAAAELLPETWDSRRVVDESRPAGA